MNEKELQLAIAEAAKSAGTAPKTAYSELVREILQPRHITYDVFRQFLDVETLEPGDYTVRKIRKGKFKARTMVPGAQHLTDAIIYQSQFAYQFSRLICGTSMNLMEVRNGEMGTVEEIKRELRADLVDESVARIYNLLTTVWSSTNTPSNFTDATSTGLTATVLDSAIENLIEKAGNVKAIVGTRRALLPLYAFAGYKDVLLADGTTRQALRMEELLLERFRTGRINMYNGIPVVEMPQILENRLPTINRKLVRDDLVMLIGDNAGKVALFGAAEEQEHVDYSKQPGDWVCHVWQSWGLLIDRPEFIQLIKVS